MSSKVCIGAETCLIQPSNFAVICLFAMSHMYDNIHVFKTIEKISYILPLATTGTKCTYI